MDITRDDGKNKECVRQRRWQLRCCRRRGQRVVQQRFLLFAARLVQQSLNPFALERKEKGMVRVREFVRTKTRSMSSNGNYQRTFFTYERYTTLLIEGERESEIN